MNQERALFNFIKKIKPPAEGYLLRLEDIQISEKSIICIFSEKGGITPLRVNINEIFENLNVYNSIAPETLIVLRKIYEITNKTKNSAKISAILNKNIYEITYNNKFKTKITGDNICLDYDILAILDIKDAFKIIYNTAFNHALTAYFRSSQKNIESSQESTENIMNPQRKLRLVK